MRNFKSFLTESADSTPVRDLYTSGKEFFFATKVGREYGDPFTIYDYGDTFLFRCPAEFCDITYKGADINFIELWFNRKGTVTRKTVCTTDDDYDVTSLSPKLRKAFSEMAKQLKPYVKSLTKFGVESNFYKEITKNYWVWCDEDFLFAKLPHCQPDNDAADYMLKKGDIPDGY